MRTNFFIQKTFYSISNLKCNFCIIQSFNKSNLNYNLRHFFCLKFYVCEFIFYSISLSHNLCNMNRKIPKEENLVFFACLLIKQINHFYLRFTLILKFLNIKSCNK